MHSNTGSAADAGAALVFLPNLKEKIVDIIAVVDTMFLFYAFIHYYFAYFGKHTKIQNLDN